MSRREGTPTLLAKWVVDAGVTRMALGDIYIEFKRWLYFYLLKQGITGVMVGGKAYKNCVRSAIKHLRNMGCAAWVGPATYRFFL